MNGLPFVSRSKKVWIYLSCVLCWPQVWLILYVKSRTVTKLRTGKYFAYSEEISDMEQRQTPAIRELRWGRIHLERPLGQQSSFPFPSSLLITSWLGVLEIHSSGRPMLMSDANEHTDALRLRSWTEACSGNLSTINLASPTPSGWSSWLASFKGGNSRC